MRRVTAWAFKDCSGEVCVSGQRRHLHTRRQAETPVRGLRFRSPCFCALLQPLKPKAKETPISSQPHRHHYVEERPVDLEDAGAQLINQFDEYLVIDERVEGVNDVLGIE